MVPKREEIENDRRKNSLLAILLLLPPRRWNGVGGEGIGEGGRRVGVEGVVRGIGVRRKISEGRGG